MQPGDGALVSSGSGRINADTLRSMIILDDLLKLGTEIVLYYTDCGLVGTSDKPIRVTMRDRTPEKAQEIGG